MTIIVTRRRHFLVFHLEAKYEKKKKKKKKKKKDYKNEIYAKNWIKSTLTAKSQL